MGVRTRKKTPARRNLYRSGDYDGVAYDTRDVTGSDELYMFGGFQAKNREFIDSLKTGEDVTSSPFRDTRKTMQIAEMILAKEVLRTTSTATP